MVNLGNLMDLIGGNASDSRNQVLEKKTGVESSTALKLASLAIPLILRGISKNMDSKDGKKALDSALDKHKGTMKNANTVEELISSADQNDGDKILGHVFSNKDQVIGQISKQTGVNQNEVSKVMASLAPLVMQTLANKKEEQNLDADGVAMQAQQLSKEAEQTAANEFQLTDLFKQLGGGTNDKKDSGLGGALGSILDNLF